MNVAGETIPSILLIDDKIDNLNNLAKALEKYLKKEEARIVLWVPSDEDGDLQEAFDSRADLNTVLVITDYDLTTAVKGLFGLTIVSWCQAKSIPVGDFSRGKITALPKEPNLFELRVPPSDQEGAEFIAASFRGFQAIAAEIAKNPAVVMERRSLSAVLASLLGRSQLDNQLALYMTRLGAANSSLMQQLRDFADEKKPEPEEKIQLLVYVLGHVLLNSILKYPGPILSAKALCAYMATDTSEAAALGEIFEAALYNGPFSSSGRYYWLKDVEGIIDVLGAGIDQEFEAFADLNRVVVERALNRALARHPCNRCGGVKGGFWCPFTARPVCERADCSIPSSSWIPQGARMSRVERDFYDEWAPVLGL